MSHTSMRPRNQETDPAMRVGACLHARCRSRSSSSAPLLSVNPSTRPSARRGLHRQPTPTAFIHHSCIVRRHRRRARLQNSAASAQHHQTPNRCGVTQQQEPPSPKNRNPSRNCHTPTEVNMTLMARANAPRQHPGVHNAANTCLTTRQQHLHRNSPSDLRGRADRYQERNPHLPNMESLSDPSRTRCTRPPDGNGSKRHPTAHRILTRTPSLPASERADLNVQSV